MINHQLPLKLLNDYYDLPLKLIFNFRILLVQLRSWFVFAAEGLRGNLHPMVVSHDRDPQVMDGLLRYMVKGWFEGSPMTWEITMCSYSFVFWVFIGGVALPRLLMKVCWKWSRLHKMYHVTAGCLRTGTWCWTKMVFLSKGYCGITGYLWSSHMQFCIYIDSMSIETCTHTSKYVCFNLYVRATCAQNWWSGNGLVLNICHSQLLHCLPPWRCGMHKNGGKFMARCGQRWQSGDKSESFQQVGD